MELSKCGKDGCNPVEQMRGQMKPEDHHLQFNRHIAVEKFAEAVEEHGVLINAPNFRRDCYEVEDLGSDNNHDLRISCSKCGKSTGWDRRDTEEYRNKAPGETIRVCIARDGNVAAVRARWNEMVAALPAS